MRCSPPGSPSDAAVEVDRAGKKETKGHPPSFPRTTLGVAPRHPGRGTDREISPSFDRESSPPRSTEHAGKVSGYADLARCARARRGKWTASLARRISAPMADQASRGGLDIPAIYAECRSLPREHPLRTLTRSAWSCVRQGPLDQKTAHSLRHATLPLLPAFRRADAPTRYHNIRARTGQPGRLGQARRPRPHAGGRTRARYGRRPGPPVCVAADPVTFELHRPGPIGAGSGS